MTKGDKSKNNFFELRPYSDPYSTFHMTEGVKSILNSLAIEDGLISFCHMKKWTLLYRNMDLTQKNYFWTYLLLSYDHRIVILRIIINLTFSTVWLESQDSLHREEGLMYHF